MLTEVCNSGTLLVFITFSECQHEARDENEPFTITVGAKLYQRLCIQFQTSPKVETVGSVKYTPLYRSRLVSSATFSILYSSSAILEVMSMQSSVRARSRTRSPARFCVICKRRFPFLQTCVICSLEVCKKDLFWCSKAQCEYKVCRKCQEHDDVKVKHMYRTTWLCADHQTSNYTTNKSEAFCAYCKSTAGEMHGCWFCSSYSCHEHRHWCSIADCGYSICKQCQSSPETCVVKSDLGWRCRMHAEMGVDQRL